MRIDELHLRNFRGFEDFRLDLHPEWTVLVGANASGKSSILEALSIAAGSWLLGFPDQYVPSIPREAVRQQILVHEGLPSLEAQYPVCVSAKGIVRGTRMEWIRDLHSKDGRTTHAQARKIKDLAARTSKRIQAGEPMDLPVLAYYGTGRLWVQKRERAGSLAELPSRSSGYDAALEPASDQKRFEAWMEWRETARLQAVANALARGQTAADGVPPHLEAVYEAARQCLPAAERIFYSVNFKELRIELKDGRTLPFSLLSDGQRNLLGMAADIAWRAVTLNPHHGAEAARKAEGVVLIDELELHLHPAWQRRVIDDLRRAFPKLQFVVTTHSPQVIAAAKPEWMRLLAAGQDHASPSGPVRGKDTNAILREVLGDPGRPPWMEAKLDRLARLIEDGDTDEARRLLDEVRADLGQQDTTLLGLEWELHDREVHGAAD